VKDMKKSLSIKLKRSLIGKPEKQRKIVRALGLRRMNHEVLHEDTPSIRGMINKISHMLDVSDAKGDRGK
jgi:large subunit ribosomal protein L30